MCACEEKSALENDSEQDVSTYEHPFWLLFVNW